MEVQLDHAAFPQNIPLPLYEAVQIGKAVVNDEVFIMHIGLDKNIVAQLKAHSLDMSDISLQENTSDFKRFGEGSYEQWYAKNRVPFALIHEATGVLAALIWYGPKQLGRKSLKHLSEVELKTEHTVESGEWHTIVQRSYLPFRGKGLMSGFAKATMEVYQEYFPEARLWAGINRTNEASVALATKLGFTMDEAGSDASWVLMVK